MESNSKIKLTNFSDLINKYKLFIFDCDGVIWVNYSLLNPSTDCLVKLHQENKLVRFLTNNNRKSKSNIADNIRKDKRLESIIKDNQVFTSSSITALHIKNNYPNIKKLYVIGNDNLSKEINRYNIQTVNSYMFDDKYYNSEKENDETCIVDNDIDGVVAGYDKRINEFKLLYAQRAIIIRYNSNYDSNSNNNKRYFFGTNIDSYIKGNYGLMLGTYSIISSIENSTNTKAEIVTKPDPRSLDLILKGVYEDIKGDSDIDCNDYKLELKDILMIGDNMKTDIKFANNSKIDSVLVLTGVTDEKVLNNSKHDSIYGVPTYICKDLSVN